MTNFWQKLANVGAHGKRAKGVDGKRKPFFALAPMANVTDAAFRKMLAKYGKPDVTWTEFVSADGLVSAGRERLLVDLKFSKAERPIVAQLFGSRPETMRQAAKLVAELGFDGLDLNMGCPDRAVEKQGGGAAMMKDPQRALAILQAAREGWLEGCKKKNNKSIDSTLSKLAKTPSGLPISIKTRVGYNKIDLEWIELLLSPNLPALTVHLRTRKEMSEVPAHWELMPKIVNLRDHVQKDIPPNERTLIIGNGDVVSLADAREKAEKYGCDGVMIGRGVFGKPWFFNEKKSAIFTKPETRLKIMLEHATLFEKMFGNGSLKKIGGGRLKNFAVMKKHFKAYVSGWDGAKELRVKLMEAETLREVKKIVSEFLC
jgi:nifR3 family TIM-barrel protein